MMSPQETVCIKCQSLFAGKNKKNISKCHLLELLPSIVSANTILIYSRLSLFQTRLSRITAYLEVKIWSLLKH